MHFLQQTTYSGNSVQVYEKFTNSSFVIPIYVIVKSQTKGTIAFLFASTNNRIKNPELHENYRVEFITYLTCSSKNATKKSEDRFKR